MIDADGAYNDPIEFNGDYNHRTEAASREWCDVCDSLSDKICQPTFRPCRANVRPFLFTSYDRHAGSATRFLGQSVWYDLRWSLQISMARHVPASAAIEPVRDRVGLVALSGKDGFHARVGELLKITEQYYVDREYLKRLNVDVNPQFPTLRSLPRWDRPCSTPL